MKRSSYRIFLFSFSILIISTQVVNAGVWRTQWTGSRAGLTGIWASSKNDVFCVGGAMRGGVIRHYDGLKWSDLYCSRALTSVWGTSSNNVYAVGSDATLIHYDGTSWSFVDVGKGFHFAGIWGTSDANYFTLANSESRVDNLVSYNGFILQHNGTSYKTVYSGGYFLNHIWGNSENNIYAAGTDRDFGKVVHFDGSEWKVISNELFQSYDLRSISGNSNRVYVVGYSMSSGEQSVFQYDGTNWTKIYSAPDGFNFYSIYATESNGLLIGGYFRRFACIVHLDNTLLLNISKISFLPFLQAPVLYLWGDSDDNIYGVGLNKIYHYTN